MKRIHTAALAVAIIALAGCQNPDGSFGTKQTLGGLGGAAAGGVAGAQFGKGRGQLAMTAGGVLLGALLGGEVGRSLDRADQVYAGRAVQQAYEAPIGEKIVWSNPKSGNSGVIVPTREGRQPGTNAYCREYQQTVTVGGRTQQAFGQACQQPDGTWKIVS